MATRRYSKRGGETLSRFNLTLNPALMARMDEVAKELEMSKSALLEAGAQHILNTLTCCPHCGKAVGWDGELLMASSSEDGEGVVCDHCGVVI